MLREPAEAGRLDAVVLGGDRSALATVLEDVRLAACESLAVERVLEVGDPRLKVLQATPDAFRATVVRVVADPAGSGGRGAGLRTAAKHPADDASNRTRTGAAPTWCG